MICTGRIPMGLRSTVDGITGNLWGLFQYAYYHAHFITCMCIIMHMQFQSCSCSIMAADKTLTCMHVISMYVLVLYIV